MICLDCSGNGCYQPVGPVDTKECPECKGLGRYDYDIETILGEVDTFLRSEGPSLIPWLAEQGWTYWDLYPDDRPRFVNWGLPEGPSRDTYWAERLEQ